MRLENLRQRRYGHPTIGLMLFSEQHSDLYMLDLLTLAVLERSMSLHRAIEDLIVSENYPCAAALIRLQLDSCLRYFAVSLVADSQSLIMDVLDGERISRMKDKSGAKMTDQYLLGQLLDHYPEISDRVQRVYERTSGFVHLSKVHMHLPVDTTRINLSEAESGMGSPIAFRVSGRDVSITDQVRCEAIDGFSAITDILLDLVTAWIKRKGELSQLGGS